MGKLTGVQLSKLFEESVQKYLQAVQPQYNGDRFEIRERELQAFFMGRLIQQKHNVRAEGQYPDASQKRYDLLLQQVDAPDTYIEIEWDATWTDGFRKRTFEDLEKLCKHAPNKSQAAFFAVNISNKWDNTLPYADRPSSAVSDPAKLPLGAGRNRTALGRYWTKTSEDVDLAPLLRHGLRLTYWKYEFAPENEGPFNVLVLACVGKKISAKNWVDV